MDADMSLMLGELMLHDVNAMEVEEVLKKRPFGQKILWTWRGGPFKSKVSMGRPL